MKILYIANSRLPTENAHGVQITKMCEALARTGAEVVLLVPRRLNYIKTDIFSYYGLEHNFKIRALPTIDANYFGWIGFWLQNIIFSLGTVFYCLVHSDFELIYSRDELPLLFLSFLKKKTVWEIHVNRLNFLVRCLVKRVSLVVTISGGLKQFLINQGVTPAKLFVSHDAVDLGLFARMPADKMVLRKNLGLPAERSLVTYVGKYTTMNKDKGVDALIKAFALVHQRLPNSSLLLVGIQATVVDQLKNNLAAVGLLPEDVIIVTHQPHEVAMQYVRAGDVVVMNYPQLEHYTLYMSPLKLFEYMAGKNVIVSTSLPSIREVLSSAQAYLVEADKIPALADGIHHALTHPEESAQKATAAFELVHRYTWDARVANILQFVRERGTHPGP